MSSGCVLLAGTSTPSLRGEMGGLPKAEAQAALQSRWQPDQEKLTDQMSLLHAGALYPDSRDSAAGTHL